MFLKTKRKIYELKFGLKGLILLRENLDIVATEKLKFLLYCGLISQQPDITFQEIQEIIDECDLSFLEQPTLLSIYEIQELYTKAVGEVGIAPTDFYTMTVEEIDLAYEGYLRRKETEANLTKIAIMTSNNEDLIRLTDDKGYSIGNLKERAEIFERLQIRGE